MDTASSLFQQALHAHHQGLLNEAHGLYAHVSALDESHPEALHLRGVICLQWGQAAIGIELIQQALRLQPDNAKAHFNIANAFLGQQLYDDALDHFDLALKHKPGYPQALTGQAKALLSSERPYSALVSLAQALRLQPNFLDAHLYLVLSQAQLAQFESAQLRLTQLTQLFPDQALVTEIAQRVMELRQVHVEQTRAYVDATAVRPSAELFAQLGTLAHGRRDFLPAIAFYNASLAENPLQAKVFHLKGLSHLGIGQFYGAIECFDHATSLDPNMGDAWHNAGSALCDLHQYPAAIAQFKQAIRASSDKASSRFMLLMAQLNICDWQEFDDLQRHIVDHIKEGQCPMQPLNVLAICNEPEVLLKAAQAHSQSTLAQLSAEAFKPRKKANARIRVGYFSRDFRDHAVSYLAAELFELHDREQFEVIAFNFGEKKTELMQDRLRRSFDQFLDVQDRSDEQIIQLARSMQIDIAVDLAGYTADHRAGIFARRAAPIQINYLGFPGTMGHSGIDYIIGDPIVTPSHWHQAYSEKVISLPCFQVNDRQRAISTRQFSRTELGIPDEHFVFCCFNASYKINPPLFDAWLSILKACPMSSLLLIKDHDQTEINLKQRAQSQGLDPSRLIFCPKIPPHDNLARYRVADLFLDSSPFNAGTTASDALWAGLPVLTCMGQSFAGRMAASLLHAIGLPQLVTQSWRDYAQEAIRLASTPGLVADLKAQLSDNRLRYPLFDTPFFVQQLEAAYVQAHQWQQQGLPPQAIDVSQHSPAS